VVLVHEAGADGSSWGRVKKFMAERMQATVHTHDANHAPLITRPKVVVDIIVEAVNSGH
jgi:hypothetical protein